MLTDSLASLEFIPLVWVFLSFSILHELEEWNIHGFERRLFSGVPDYATDRSARGVIAFVCAAGLVWTSAAALSGNPAIAAWIIVPAIFFMVMNALQHVYWSILFRRFAPGIFTAACLIIPLGGYLIFRAVSRGYVPAGYAAAWAVLFTAIWVQTILAGSRMTHFLRGVYAIGHWISERIPDPK
ncbi:MAG: HXXEE domain-containing protein [Anaerolineales bacterium]|nr:HXXEE domain-containing protein [Anaerolineales bacterium]